MIINPKNLSRTRLGTITREPAAPAVVAECWDATCTHPSTICHGRGGLGRLPYCTDLLGLHPRRLYQADAESHRALGHHVRPVTS